MMVSTICFSLSSGSVPMHMAAALGTPLVALFGPSKLTFWRPWQAKGDSCQYLFRRRDHGVGRN
jgi:ADP-heptose:LPS heptosyltransferase